MPDLVLDFPLSSCLQTCCNIQYQPLEAITAQVFDKRAGPLYSPLITVLGLFLGGGGCMNRLFTDCYFVYIFSPELTLLGCYSMYSMSALYSVLYFLPSSLLPVFYKQTWNVNRFFFSQAKIYLYGKESTKALLKKKKPMIEAFTNIWCTLILYVHSERFFELSEPHSMRRLRKCLVWEHCHCSPVAAQPEACGHLDSPTRPLNPTSTCFWELLVPPFTKKWCKPCWDKCLTNIIDVISHFLNKFNSTLLLCWFIFHTDTFLLSTQWYYYFYLC